MKKLLMIFTLLFIAVYLFGTALNDANFNETYENLMWIDNTSYDGVTTSQQDVCDAAGNAIGFGVSTTSIRMSTGYILEWRTGNLFMYDHSATGLTIDADTELLLLGTTEIDLTSALLDLNATTIHLDATSIATTGTLLHTGSATVTSNFNVNADFDSDGITNLDVTDIDGALQVDAAVQVGTSGLGQDVIFHSGTASEELTWDSSEEKLIIDGVAGTTALEVSDGNFVVADDAVITGSVTAGSFIGSITGKINLNGEELVIDADGDTKILADTDDQIDIYVGDIGTAKYQITTNGINPVKTDTYTCGSLGSVWMEMQTSYLRTARLIVTGGVAGTIDNTSIGVTTPLAGKFTTLEATQNVIFNDAQADYDFRVETGRYDHTLFVEGGSDNVGIGDATPDAKLHIKNTDADPTVEVLKIENVSGSPADDDELRVGLYNTARGAGQHEFARIAAVSEDVTDTTEDGELKLSVTKAGTMTDIVTVGEVGMLIEGSITCDAINGTTSLSIDDTYEANLSPAIDSYTTFLSVYLIVGIANTGVCRLSLNGLAAIDIKTVSGADPATNDILTTGVSHFVYNGTNFILMNPATTCD